MSPNNFPDSLRECALIDATTAAAALGCAVSHWYSLVASGEAPQPILRRHRFTRWRMMDVQAFIERLASEPENFETREHAKRARAIRTAREVAEVRA
jgi:predicted DNA-binding transcriptional regulator AlpA